MANHTPMAKRFVMALGLLSAADLVFLVMRVLLTGTVRYWFVPENLALAWISLIFSWILTKELKNRRWLSWQNLSLTALWLVFLPNSWYVLTDFIHIFPNGEISQLYDIVLISLLVFIGFILGFAGLFLVHRQLLSRLGAAKSYFFVEAAILTSSFAIYLGRDLRWNSWDVLTNPGGVILNVSDRIGDPLGSPRALNVTLLFFIMINVMYLAFWIFTRPPVQPRP
jgi:uncharacterized membrane protein